MSAVGDTANTYYLKRIVCFSWGRSVSTGIEQLICSSEWYRRYRAKNSDANDNVNIAAELAVAA